jgi:16S rRNA (guanine966-N2)-methyltransferase
MSRRNPGGGPGAPHRNRFRIIGGHHRGRRLAFPDLPALRPSPDRVRETLFNWLGPRLPGARCLDLYAGSGALGLEALSRGAAHVTFIDEAPAAVRAIKEHLALLDLASRARALEADAPGWLQRCVPQPYDIVFVDPPFADNAWERLCTLLIHSGAVRNGALIYVEYPVQVAPSLPSAWVRWKRSRAGRVAFQLVRVQHEQSVAATEGEA